MNRLNLIKKKLNQLGYSVYIEEDNSQKVLKGGYTGDDIEKNLSIHINVLIENNEIVFIDIDKQIASKIIFETVDETIHYTKNKYPIE
ncbi:hypothetical protein [Winogradskyella sp. 3972H.M.0a.05]|uniref:hypothetical protein n=1 Tax=Winogradskyella sp. 3972H.M.0a.05 TaxID=2950277 RepID=UPI003390A0AF